MLEKKGNLDEAIAEYRTVGAPASWLCPARQSLGGALSHEGDIDGTIAEYREGVRLEPER